MTSEKVQVAALGISGLLLIMALRITDLYELPDIITLDPTVIIGAGIFLVIAGFLGRVFL